MASQTVSPADEHEGKLIKEIASLRKDSRHEEAYLILKEMKEIKDPVFRDFGYFDELGICCWWIGDKAKKDPLSRDKKRGQEFDEEGKKALQELWNRNTPTPEGRKRLEENSERLVGNMSFYDFPTEEVTIVTSNQSVKGSGCKHPLVSLAKLLSKEFKVHVYGHPDSHGIDQYPFSNPRFSKVEKFDESEKRNVLILFGRNSLVETVKAEKKFLWSCNFETPPDPRFLVFSTRSVWVSQFQMLRATNENKEFMRSEVIPLHLDRGLKVPDEKEIAKGSLLPKETTFSDFLPKEIAKSGLLRKEITFSDPPPKDPSAKRNIHKCVYTGKHAGEISKLAEIWPRVKEKVPAATLEVTGSGLSEESKAVLMSVGVPFSSEDGDLTSREEKVLAESGFWVNPAICDSPFSMTAIKAQALGAIPVIVFSGCLRDLVEFGFSSSIKDFENVLTTSLQGASTLDGHRHRMMRTIGEKYSEAAVLDRWKKLFLAKV